MRHTNTSVFLDEEGAGFVTRDAVVHTDGQISVEVVAGLWLCGTPQQLCQVFTRSLRAAKPHLPIESPAEVAARGLADCRAALQVAS